MEINTIVDDIKEEDNTETSINSNSNIEIDIPIIDESKNLYNQKYFTSILNFFIVTYMVIVFFVAYNLPEDSNITPITFVFMKTICLFVLLGILYIIRSVIDSSGLNIMGTTIGTYFTTLICAAIIIFNLYLLFYPDTDPNTSEK